MGYSSQTGLFGLGIQGSKGTPVAATRFARLRGGGLGGDRSLLIPDSEIGGNRDIPQAYLGPVSFSGDIDFYPRMEMVAMLLRGVLGGAASSNVAGTSEVQTITITGTPAGGTFTLTYRGQTTSAIAYNAAAAAIDTALEALSSVGAGNVVAAGGPLPTTPVTITFGGTLAATNPPMMTAVSSLTGGTAPAIAITASTPGAAPIGTHIITPSDTLPWFTIEERKSNTYESFQYTDAKINSMHLECDAAGFLMGSANIMALSGVSGFSAQSSPAIDTSPMMVGTQISLLFGGVTLNAKSFGIDITNNIEGEDYVLGSLYGADLTEKRRELKLTANRRPQNSTMWKNAMWGSSALSAPQGGPAYSGPAQLVISAYEFIAGTTPYSCTFDIPNLVIAPFNTQPNGDDVMSEDLELTATRPDPLVPLVTVTVKNDVTTVV